MTKAIVSRPKRHREEGIETAQRSPLYRGFTKATFSIRPDQLEALRAEARLRADTARQFRADVSAVVRDALDTWLKRPQRTDARKR